MIRWRYVLTRIAIVTVILLLLGWALGPVATYVTERGLQNVTGAKVEIAKTEVGFFPPRLMYSDVRIADPRSDKEMKDLVRAETINLVVDAKALLHRRWVAREGEITGLQIGAARETSGHLEPQPGLDSGNDTSSSAGMLSGFLRGATNQLGDKAQEAVGSLETVKKSREIKQRWLRDYETLVVKARGLEGRVREIRETAARGFDNPLRDWEQLNRTLERATTTRNELLLIRQTIDGLPERLKTDLANLEQAKQIDLERVNQYLPTDLSQSDDFGIDLMSSVVRKQIARVQQYIDSGRELANYTVVAPEEAERNRGIDYDLLGAKRPAELLVRKCLVSGTMRADGDVYLLSGTLENLTPTPLRLTEPTRAKLQLEGPDIVEVEFVRNHREGADIDQISLHWPKTEARPMKLGSADDVGISILGGQRELRIELQSQGDQISGRLVSQQTGVKMKLDIDSRYAQSPAAMSLSRSLAGVDNLQIDANFHGTWKDVKLKLNSNIGRIFQTAARDAVAGQINATRRDLAAKVEQAHLKETLALRRWLETRQTEAQGLLAAADKSIVEMREKVISEIGEADAYIGLGKRKLKSAVEGYLR